MPRRPLASLCPILLLAAAATRAPAVTAPDGFTASALVRGLAQPTAIAFAPDGRLFVLEKAGAVRLWTPGGGLAAEPVITLPSCTASEMGLLGVAADPDFGRTGHLYLYHTHPPGGDPRRCGEGSTAGRRNRVVRVTVTGDRADPSSLTELLGGIRTDNGNHDGGCLRIGPDGLLYVGAGDTGLGDFGRPGQSTNPYARDLNALEGKILRLTLDGRPAPDNPFLGRGGAADYVFASGLRNPFRFGFDARTGLLWVGDVGQGAFEEISIARPGDDLGWPQCEGFQPAPPCPGTTAPPVYVYPRPADGASVTGGVFYDGTQFDLAYRGDYFFGDFVLDRVWRARLDGSRTRFAAEPEVFLRAAAGPVDFAVGPDGALFYVAFKAGEVVRVAQRDADEAPGSCARALAGAAPRLVDSAGRRPAVCAPDCPVPALRPGARRTLARACVPPPAAACAGLRCAGCGAVAELGACLAASAAAVASETLEVVGPATDRCTRRARRVAIRGAALRVRAVARCVRRGGASCAGAAPSRLPRLGGVCRRPPAALCGALGCADCTGAALGACLDRATSAPAAALAGTLIGR